MDVNQSSSPRSMDCGSLQAFLRFLAQENVEDVTSSHCHRSNKSNRPLDEQRLLWITTTLFVEVAADWNVATEKLVLLDPGRFPQYQCTLSLQYQPYPSQRRKQRSIGTSQNEALDHFAMLGGSIGSETEPDGDTLIEPRSGDAGFGRAQLLSRDGDCLDIGTGPRQGAGSAAGGRPTSRTTASIVSST